MLGSEILDIVIGLIFIYLLYSLLATIIQEIVATNFAFRAKILEKALTRMLDDGDNETGFHWAAWDRITGFLRLFWRKKRKTHTATDLFYKHPLPKYLGEDRWHSKPSYIEAKDFSKVLLDLLKSDPGTPGEDIRIKIEEALKEGKLVWTIGDVKHSIQINSSTLSYLRSLWSEAQGDIEKFRSLTEDWFDETMKRATGWYKRYTQLILFIIGFVIAITFNVDTILIVHKLEKDPKLREQIVQNADSYIKAHTNLPEELATIKKESEAFLNSSAFDSLSRILTKKQADSLAEVKLSEIKNRRNILIAKADSLIKSDISKTNNLLGIDRDNPENKNRSGWLSFVGWLITAIALSMGAPFWFDLLNKLMKLRSAIPKKTNNQESSQSSKEISRKG